MPHHYSKATQYTAETPLTQADLLVDFIHQIGTEVVFGVPGGAIEPFYNALARSERVGGPRIVTARHESGAAFMADGYYRESGKMGVVCTTTGPGATNLMTGVSSAMAEHIPMLVITAQTPLPKFGRGALQESSCTAIDTVAMLKHCTVFNTLVSHADQLQAKLISATMSAHRKPGGPAHISVPSDVLRSQAKGKTRLHVDLLVNSFGSMDTSATHRLQQKLVRVDSVAVYIDGGVGAATDAVVEFCELTNSPFVVSLTGKYWVDESHPLYRGVYGFAGHSSAKELFEDDVDLVLAVGAAMDELSTSGWDSQLLNSKLVHIDNNTEHFFRSPMANLHVAGNIENIFSSLNQYVREQRLKGRRWLCCSPADNATPNIYGGMSSINSDAEALVASNPVKPQYLMKFFSDHLPVDTRIFIDAGNVWAWITHYYQNTCTQGLLRSGMGLGAMAWSVGAAVGSAIANPSVPTVCLVGDGAYLMSAQEITVAAEHHLPVIFIVLNDAAYGMVMHGQQLGGAEPVGWQLLSIDYAAIAAAMGIHNIVIEHADDLTKLNFDELTQRRGPTLIDIRIDRNQVPPMGQRVQSLATFTPGA